MNLNWSYTNHTQTWTALIYLPVSKIERETKIEYIKKYYWNSQQQKNERQQRNKKNDQITDTLLGMGIIQSICKQMGWFHFHFMSSWFLIYVIYSFFDFFLYLIFSTLFTKHNQPNVKFVRVESPNWSKQLCVDMLKMLISSWLKLLVALCGQCGDQRLAPKHHQQHRLNAVIKADPLSES